MKQKLAMSLLLTGSLAVGVTLSGCDQEKEKAKIVEDVISAQQVSPDGKVVAEEEISLNPTNMQPGAPQKALNAKDPSLWKFLPDVVAEVDGKKITKQEVIDFFASQMPNGQLPPMMTPELLQQITPGLIKSYVDRPLLMAAAAKAGFTPSPELIMNMLKEQMKQIPPADMEEFKKQLAQNNQTIDGFMAEMAGNKDLQEKVALEKYLESAVLGKITVTDEAAKKFYEENKANFAQPGDPNDSIRASHILIAAKKDASPEDIAKAKAQAETILKTLQADQSQFEAIAQKDSACPSGKQNKGSLGAFSKGQMVPEFEEAAFSLKDGEISGIVQTSFGFHIIRRDKSEAGKQLSFDEVKANVIEMLKRQEFQDKVEDLIENLEKENHVKIFVAAPEADNDMD